MIRRKILLGFLRKEFKQMFRDSRMRVVLFGAPVLMLLLFGYAVSTDVRDIKMAIFDEDKSFESRKLIEKFTSSNYFIPVKFLEDNKQMDPLLDSGQAEVVIHIENGFERKIRSGRTAAVQIVVDGTDSSRAAVVVSHVNAVTTGFSFDFFTDRIRLSLLSRQSQGFRFQKTVELQERFFFNPDLVSRNFFMPGILGLLISMITITLTAMSIVKEREFGTIDQISVSPVSASELIAGKSIPFVIVSFGDSIVITLLLIFWFKVPFNGSFIFLLLVFLVFVFSTVAVGLFISTISRTQQQALLSVFMYFLPSLMFSGFVFPIYAMPDVIQWLTLINPMRYFMTIIRGIFLKGVGIEVLWLDLSAMAFLGAALFYFSTRRFANRMD